jgi:hypothetical protein
MRWKKELRGKGKTTFGNGGKKTETMNTFLPSWSSSRFIVRVRKLVSSNSHFVDWK